MQTLLLMVHRQFLDSHFYSCFTTEVGKNLPMEIWIITTILIKFVKDKNKCTSMYFR